MATPQLSPGVLTREVDLTVGRAENVLDNIGGIAGPFEIGPVSEPINIATEQDLIGTFGKPYDNDAQYEYWMSASQYLSYGGVLKVIRSDDDNLANGNVGVGTSSVASTKIKNFDDYNTNYLDAASNFYYAAKNPGTWSNGVKVCYIDDMADQVIGIATTSVANMGAQVGYGITVDISGQVIPGAGSTSVFAGYLKGVITEVVNAPDTGTSILNIKVRSRVSTGGTQPGLETPVAYAEGSQYASFLKNQRLTILDSDGDVVSPEDSIETIGITTYSQIQGQQDQTYTGVGGTTGGGGAGATFDIVRNSTNGGVASATINNAGVGYTVGDTVSVAGTSVGGYDLSQGTINTVGLTTFTTVPSASSGTYTNLTGVSAEGTGAIFTIFRDASGGIGTVSLTSPGSAYGVGTTITVSGAGIGGTAVTDDVKLSVSALRNDEVILTCSTTNSRVLVAGVDDWYNSRTLGLDNATVFWRSIAPKPGTSNYSGKRGGRNDEMHIVVVDDSGSLTGIQGNILEKHLSLSKATDAISEANAPTKIWYKSYLANYSDYIYAGSNQSNANDSYHGTYPTGTYFDTGSQIYGQDTTVWYALQTSKTTWDVPAKAATFSSIGAHTYSLAAGQNYTSGGGLKAELGDLIAAYNLFDNKDEVQVDYLLMGPSADNLSQSQAKANKLIAVAESRKDCVACLSPHKGTVVNITDPIVQTANVVEFFGPLTSSSYAIFDSGYKYTYDRFNNKFRYLPCNPDIAGLMCRTNLVAYPWFSPAGQQRGNIKNAIKLAYNPTKSQRDILYSNRINAIINTPGTGIILFGDKTALSYASAFDRINVRRLFLTVEQALEKAAQAQLFEFNDQITRANFVNIVEPYLRDVQSKRGIYDYLVICDETNNTPDIIDNNEFRADIFLKPAKSINYITLTFVATRTGVSFEEVAGRV